MANHTNIEALLTKNSPADQVYVRDIYDYMIGKEAKERKNPYMNQQSEITFNMRAILIDWLVELMDEYKMVKQTLFLAIHYMDKYLEKTIVPMRRFQLVGVAAMLMASKIEEEYPPEIGEFVYISDGSCTTEEIIEMERRMCASLEWRLLPTTPMDLVPLWRLAAVESIPDLKSKEHEFKNLVDQITMLNLIEYETSVEYLPSMVTASAILLGIYTITGVLQWTPLLEEYTKLSLDEIIKCTDDLWCLHRNCKSMILTSIQELFSKMCYLRVAKTIEPAKISPVRLRMSMNPPSQNDNKKRKSI